jgi:SRSO17 transposase
VGNGLERRFESYGDKIAGALMHADRGQPFRWYIKGLMLPGHRKSVEPMAARVQPDNVRSVHQSMHHLVADSPWSDEAVLSAVGEQVLPELLADESPVWWIVDDTGFPKRLRNGTGSAPAKAGGRSSGESPLSGKG